MEICFVNNGSINEFFYSGENYNADVYVFSFSSLGEINYEDELLYKSFKLEDLVCFSRQLNSVIACGCYTKSYSVEKRSIAVAEKGKLLGISDAVNCCEGDKYKCGSSLRVYETTAGRIGVVVANDLYFYDSIKVLSLGDCDLILCVFEDLTSSITKVVARSLAFCFGVDIGVCCNDYSFLVNCYGEVKYASANRIMRCEVLKHKKYITVSTRNKGMSVKTNDTF